MFEEDFDDGKYTGWGTNGTWSAANGYMANSRYASGISQFYRSRTAADAEFRYSYSNEDTSNSDYYVRTDLRYRTSGQATVEFLPSTVRIREWDGSQWYVRASASLTTTQGQWYDVIARISGSSITVKRRPAGGEFEQVLTGTVNLATTTRVAFVASTNALIRVDNIRVIDGAMQSAYTMTYNNANELTQMSNSTQATTVAFTYDAWGRMVTKTQGNHLAAYRFRFGDKMTWTQSNFPDEAASVTMMYDGLGKRRYKYVSGTPNSTTYWWRWGAGLNVVNEYTDVESTWDWDPENLTATYVPDPAGMGSMAEIAGADPSSGAYRYYSGDNLGSVRRVRAQDKSSLAEYEYTPYGAVYSQSGLALNRGFTGHKWDSEIAMYWAPYRHYLPNQARWLTRDPLGMADGPNVYTYVSADPVRFMDPLGAFRIPGTDIECDTEAFALCAVAASVLLVETVGEWCVAACNACATVPSPYNPGCIACVGCVVGGGLSVVLSCLLATCKKNCKE